MHSHRPFSTLRRCLIGGAALAALTTAFYSLAQAQVANSSVATAAQDPAQPMLPAPAPGVPAGQADPAIRLEIGQEMPFRSPTGKKISRVIYRPGVVRVEEFPDNPTEIKIRAVNIGRVPVTLVDETGAQQTIVIQVLPDLSYIRETIRRHFPRTNLTIERVGESTIVITGDVEMAEHISAIIQLADSMIGKGYTINNMRLAGVVQVQLEICIAQVDRTETRTLGVNWLQSSPNSVTSSTLGGILEKPFELQSGTLTQLTIPPGFVQGSGFLGTGLGNANLSIGVFDGKSAFFGYLEALRTENIAKIMAHPTLTTISGRPAQFKVGGEEPFGTAGSGGGTGTGIEFKPFGTVVKFLPIALGNGKIRIEVQPEVSLVVEKVRQANIIAPALTTTHVETTVEMESGQTMVIGGLLQNVIDGATTKIPVLGDLPFVGAGFRKVTYRETEVELLVIVTPHVIDPLDCNQRPPRLPGQETRTPTDFELFLEGILEAPRGQRELCPDGHYKPAHYWAPAHCYPYGTPKPGCGNCSKGCYGTPGVNGGYGNGGYVRQGNVPPVMAEQPQMNPQDTNPVPQTVSPAALPESNQSQTDQAPMPPVGPPASPAEGGATPAQPEAKEATPVPSESVKPMGK
jgi:pilus assembly protein CpaC